MFQLLQHHKLTPADQLSEEISLNYGPLITSQSIIFNKRPIPLISPFYFLKKRYSRVITL